MKVSLDKIDGWSKKYKIEKNFKRNFRKIRVWFIYRKRIFCVRRWRIFCVRRYNAVTIPQQTLQSSLWMFWMFVKCWICNTFLSFKKWKSNHGRRQRGARGAVDPHWIFKHGTSIVDRGLKVLFSAFFAIFWSFFRYPSLEEAK